MTRQPMRPPARVPGFKGQNELSVQPPVVPLSRRGGTKQLNLRLLVGLDDRYRGLLRECKDAGINTSMTELVHALLHEGPSDVGDVRILLRRWRPALDEL